jgi:hypothetical protein
VKKDNINVCLLGTLLIIGFADMGTVAAQQRNFEMNRKQEIRQRRIEEFRAIRQIERQERLSEKLPQRQLQSNEKAMLPPQPAPESGERPVPRFNRLTPEERMALRKQIRDARDNIYQKRQEKN